MIGQAVVALLGEEAAAIGQEMPLGSDEAPTSREGTTGCGGAMSEQKAERRPVSETGFTLVELMVYLALMTTFLGTIAGADQLARKLYRRDAAAIAGLGSLHRLFGELEKSFDVSPAARALPDGIAFEGGSTFRFRAKEHAVFRDGTLFVGAIERFEVTRDPRHRGLVRVEIRIRGPHRGRGEKAQPKKRTYRRSFALPRPGRVPGEGQSGGEPRGGF